MNGYNRCTATGLKGDSQNRETITAEPPGSNRNVGGLNPIAREVEPRYMTCGMTACNYEISEMGAQRP